MPEKTFLPHGERILQERIACARAAGENTVVFSGAYEIAGTVLLPSRLTVILDDCHLRLADGVYCPIFRNEHALADTPDTPYDVDIHVEGRGEAILDGGNYNGLSEKTSGKNGLPSITENLTVYFRGVENFSVTGIRVVRQRWWGMCFVGCAHGRIGEINFCSDDRYVASDGSLAAGLSLRNYDAIYIKNSDGIDLRIGCHDITVENITGFTEDDTVALTALTGPLDRAWAIPGREAEIRDITVKNIRSSALCSNVRLLAQGGARMYRVTVDGVYDDLTSPHLDRGLAAVSFGDTHVYSDRANTADEVHDIVICNVVSGSLASINGAGEVADCRFENIRETRADTVRKLPAVKSGGEK